MASCHNAQALTYNLQPHSPQKFSHTLCSQQQGDDGFATHTRAFSIDSAMLSLLVGAAVGISVVDHWCWGGQPTPAEGDWLVCCPGCHPDVLPQGQIRMAIIHLSGSPDLYLGFRVTPCLYVSMLAPVEFALQ